MPVINIKVRIEGGPRTHTAIYVETYSFTNKAIKFKDGGTIDCNELCAVIDKAIIDRIEDRK